MFSTDSEISVALGPVLTSGQTKSRGIEMLIHKKTSNFLSTTE